MNYLKKSIIFRCLWLIMAMHIFNSGFDVRNANQSVFVAENVGHNVVLNIIEQAIENILAIKNFTNHSGSQGAKSLIELEEEQIYISNLFSFKFPLKFNLIFCNKSYFSYHNIDLLQFYLETLIPPPREL